MIIIMNLKIKNDFYDGWLRKPRRYERREVTYGKAQ